MKKLMIVALMAAAASTAFAGDSPTLKSILKTKSYDEAKALISSSLGSLASDAEKAAAYNKLYQLAMEKVNKEQGAMNENTAAEQFKTGKHVDVDSLGFYNAVYNAMNAALECEKYDQMPNEKGKVKPKFHDANSTALYAQRGNLINGGIYFSEREDNANTYKFFAKYVDTYSDPLFAQEAAKAPDANLGQIAYYASLYAYQSKDIQGCKKYADIAKKDEKYAEQANNLRLAAVQETLKTRADSVNYVNELEADLEKDPDNEVLFGTLVNMYTNMDMNDKLNALFDKKLQIDPNNFVVWAVRGQNAMMEQKLDDAVEYFKKALNVQPENAQILTYLGACQLDRGSNAENRAAGKTGRVPKEAMDQIRPLYEEALGYLEKAKQLDPNKEKANWGYPYYRCCYQLYGAEDPRTTEAEKFSH